MRSPLFSTSFAHAAVVLTAALVWLALIPGAASAQDGYDMPNIEEAPFSPDGLSVSRTEMDEIVQALSALARNFSANIRVDDDLREKSLAIALRLNPLDGSARSAHSSLLEKKFPGPVDFFTNLRTISDTLFKYGERLAAPNAEPDDRQLAPMLMEISLVILAQPSPEQIRAFQAAAGGKQVEWGRMVTLQGSAYESNRRAQSLIRASQPPGNPRPPNGKGKGKGKGPGNTGVNNTRVPPMNASFPNPGDARPVSEIKKSAASLLYVAIDSENKAVPGEARLKVREPREDERNLFGLFLGNESQTNDFEMRLTWDRSSTTLGGLDPARDLILKTRPRWPGNRLGDFRFSAANGSVPSQVDFGLAAALLLEAAFSGGEISKDLAVIGRLEVDHSISPPGSGIVEAIQAAGIGGKESGLKALLVPAGSEGAITDAAAAGNLAVLFRPQLVAFNSWSEARDLVFGPRSEGMQEAIRKFGEIQGLISQEMSLDEIARNNAVHGRLREILDLWPAHLSAKIMLDYGTRPAGEMSLSNEGLLSEIDGALKPVAKHYTDTVFGGGGVVGAERELLEKARNTFRALRQKISADNRDCVGAAEDVLKAFDEYFKLSNKGTSAAAQRRRELQEALNALNAERTKIGADENISF